MKSKRKQSVPGSTPATQTTLELPVTSAQPAQGSALSWFTQATIILALIPFIGYWCSLAFERGFSSYFNIPYYFISLNPTLVLYTSRPLPGIAGIAFISIVAVLIWVSFGRILKKQTKSDWAVLCFTLVGIISIPIIFRDLIKVNWQLILLVVGVSLVLPSLVTLYRDYKSEILWKYLATILFMVLVFLSLGYGFDFFYELGGKEAKNKKEFPVLTLPSSNSKVAVIRTYGEYLYGVPFHPDTKKFESEFVIVKMSDVKTPLSYKNIGPLKPEDEKQVETKPSP